MAVAARRRRAGRRRRAARAEADAPCASTASRSAPCASGHPTESVLRVTNDGGRRVRALVRDAWQPSAGATDNRHRLDLAVPATGRCSRLPLLPRRRGDLPVARGDGPRARSARTGRAAAHGPGARRRTVAAAVRVAQAPAQPAGAAPRARRPGRDPGARAGHRVRLAARVRPRRRRPLDRLAGERAQPQRRRPDLAARARPSGRAGARHLAHLGRAGSRTCRGSTRRWTRRCCWRPWPRGRATAWTSWPATGGSGRGCGRRAPETSPRTCRTRWPTSSR